MQQKKVEVEQPKVEQSAATQQKPAITPVDSRQYKLIQEPSIPPRGKQRLIVLQILRENKEKPMTIAEITPLAAKMGLSAIGGVGPSVRYHLHQMELLGQVQVVNPIAATVAA